mgnify:CR=1 FL=1
MGISSDFLRPRAMQQAHKRRWPYKSAFWDYSEMEKAEVDGESTRTQRKEKERKRQIQRIRDEEVRYIFIPANIENYHWVAIIAVPRYKRVYALNSLEATCPKVVECCNAVASFLSSIIGEEKWEPVLPPGGMLQPDGVSCGVCVVVHMEMVAEAQLSLQQHQRLGFTPEFIAAKREHIERALTSGKVSHTLTPLTPFSA